MFGVMVGYVWVDGGVLFLGVMVGYVLRGDWWGMFLGRFAWGLAGGLAEFGRGMAGFGGGFYLTVSGGFCWWFGCGLAGVWWGNGGFGNGFSWMVLST
uniref:Uncharacterized protein n=1 Tax=Knipowitschia caucasica TaxID=637954 RepID=A0AAV2JYH7_KNICA